MDARYAALLSTISNTFCDSTLDFAINKYKRYKVLLWTCFFAFIGQILFGLGMGFIVTPSSLPFIALYGVVIICGYLCFARALETIPIGLAGLLGSINLFMIFIIDIFLGYIVLTPYFIGMFALFLFSIILFTKETYKLRYEVKFKKLSYHGIIFMALSNLCYMFEPYIIKLASVQGANEIAINIGYYALALPYFYYKSLKHKGKRVRRKSEEENTIGNFITLCVLIGIFEAFYIVFSTMSFVDEAPTIVSVIQELRVFLLFLLSVVFKTDTFSFKKGVAMIIGMGAIIGIYLS